MKLLRATVALVAFMGLLAGCSPENDEPAERVDLASAIGLSAERPFDIELSYRMNDVFEEDLQTCMKEHGFEYAPDPGNFRAGRVGDDGTLSDREYAAEHGFGIWSSFTDQSPPPNIPSANDTHLAALGESERIAWFEQSSVCSRQAYENQDEAHAVLSPIFDAQAEIEEAIAADPRVVAAEGRWSQCMSLAGYNYASPFALYAALASEAQEIASEMLGDSGVAVITESEFAVTSPRGQAFAAEEISAAILNHECSEDLEQLRSTVRAEYTAERLGSNRELDDALGAVKDLFGQS